MPTEQKVIRKLRAILSADVKGYSRLMTNDEFSTIKTLKEYRKIMSGLVEDHSGRVVDAPGDNIMAEFESVVNAVQCSVDIQKVLKEKNAELLDEKRLKFRIGINIGDVVQDGDSLYGEGVNIAARIEGLADPGGICISRGAYDHLKNKLKLGYEFIGEHSVKNIKDPVRVYKVLMDSKDAGKRVKSNLKTSSKRYKIFKWIKITALIILILFAGLAGYYWKYLHLSAPDDIDPNAKIEFNLPTGPSIAVLPFVNLNKDPEQEIFCDGITDNLISVLGRTQQFLVIDRNSSFTYKNKSKNIQQIGNELDVKYIITGSIQSSNNRYRILVQLINAESGNHLWSGQYNKEFKDIFKLQDEITFEILKTVGQKLISNMSNNEMEGIADSDSFIKCAMVKNFWVNPTKMEYAPTLKIAEEIIVLNPNYLLRYDFLVIVYLTGIMNGYCVSDNACYLNASQAVKKSLSLDKNHSLALLHLSWLFLYRKDHDQALASIKKSIELDPVFAGAYWTQGAVLNYSNRPSEGLESIKLAIRLDPITPTPYLFVLAQSYLILKQYDNAIEVSTRCLKNQPNSWSMYLLLAGAYGYLGQQDKATAAIKELLNIVPDFSIEKLRKLDLYKDPTRLDNLIKVLREAGVPEG